MAWSIVGYFILSDCHTANLISKEQGKKSFLVKKTEHTGSPWARKVKVSVALFNCKEKNEFLFTIKK